MIQGADPLAPGPRPTYIDAMDLETAFLEVFLALPRQGPGDRASAERALALCANLPDAPRVLDLGAGIGGQTITLAALLPRASIVAVEALPAAVDRMRAAIEEAGLAGRVEARVGDLLDPSEAPGTVDLVWSEGALYNAGLPRALPVCRDLLRPGGYVAFTDAVWRTDDPPDEVREAFADYATMGTIDDARAAVRAAGLEPVGDFVLPDAAWWADFYGPMERRIADLRAAHAGDPETLAALDEIAREPAMRRRHGDTYGYAFLVARRP